MKAYALAVVLIIGIPYGLAMVAGIYRAAARPGPTREQAMRMHPSAAGRWEGSR